MSLQKPDKSLIELAKKWLTGTITDPEKVKFDNWYNSFDDSVHEVVSEEDENTFEKRLQNQIFEKAGLFKKPVIRRISIYRISAAAMIFLFLSVGFYWLINKKSTENLAQNQKVDFSPGHTQATLTLSNGQKIILTKGLKGTLAQQGNILVSVRNALTYTTSGENTGRVVAYNTLSTAVGEESPFPLILADGTKVWLNAKSSIRFPTAFTGNNRAVEITGEAYFEVVHNHLKPFQVKVNGQIIEDIGTHFNINAYDDEPKIKVTLLEGGVRVSGHGAIATLKPGQQAQTGITGGIKVIDNADMEEAVAWKNGLFKFSHADIKMVMRQFSRWYNVDVSYQGAIPGDGISGEIYRNVNASQALEILKYLNINYKIEKIDGINKITIAP